MNYISSGFLGALRCDAMPVKASHENAWDASDNLCVWYFAKHKLVTILCINRRVKHKHKTKLRRAHAQLFPFKVKPASPLFDNLIWNHSHHFFLNLEKLKTESIKSAISKTSRFVFLQFSLSYFPPAGLKLLMRIAMVQSGGQKLFQKVSSLFDLPLIRFEVCCCLSSNNLFF